MRDLHCRRLEDGAGGIANFWRGSLSLFVRTRAGFGPACLYCHLASRAEVDALHADLVAAGAAVSPPRDRPWGNYDFTVVDPWGNELTFASASIDDGGQPGQPAAE